VPYAPEEKVSLGLQYDRQLPFALLTAAFDWSYTGEHFVYHTPHSAGLTKVEQYDVINARISLSEIDVGAGDNTLKVSLWGKNLSDEEYRINGIPAVNPVTGAVDRASNYYGDPRTYGLDVTYEF
jgi:iron complex outermembrane receptor protein